MEAGWLAHRPLGTEVSGSALRHDGALGMCENFGLKCRGARGPMNQGLCTLRRIRTALRQGELPLRLPPLKMLQTPCSEGDWCRGVRLSESAGRDDGWQGSEARQLLGIEAHGPVYGIDRHPTGVEGDLATISTRWIHANLGEVVHGEVRTVCRWTLRLYPDHPTCSICDQRLLGMRGRSGG